MRHVFVCTTEYGDHWTKTIAKKAAQVAAMSEEEFLAPYDPGVVHLTRIPRFDQTVCCPECEGRILN